MTEHSEQQNTPSEIYFTYQHADDYRIVYATGAWGGLTPQGTIKFDLYNEYVAPPIHERRSVNIDGSLGDQIELERLNEGEAGRAINMVREMQIGAVMSPNDAEHLANWLLEKVAEWRSAQEED